MSTFEMAAMIRLIVFCQVAFVFAAVTAAQSQLTAGQTLRLTMEDLPQTFHAMNQKDPDPTAISIQLPTNYDRNRNFPMFVFIGGGHGGNGSNVKFPRSIVGDENFIVANYPLFKDPNFDRTEAWEGMRVDVGDLEAMSKAYAEITKRIHQTIPNIDKQSSVLCGHSNGAHAIAVLLSALDQPTLDAFNGFCMVEGGYDWSTYFRVNTMGPKHIKFLVGDGMPRPKPWRKYHISRVDYFKHVAQTLNLTHWQFDIMEGHAQTFPKEYFDSVKTWAESVNE